MTFFYFVFKALNKKQLIALAVWHRLDTAFTLHSIRACFEFGEVRLHPIGAMTQTMSYPYFLQLLK